MTIEEERKLNWLYIASLLWSWVGRVCVLLAGTVVVFFDSPSPNWNANNLFIFSVISFPIICIASSVGIRFLTVKHKKLAFYLSLLPVLPLILIYVGYNWMSASYSIMRNEGNAIPIATCALPVLDGGDGIETTGCGMLEDELPVTGITNSTSEAHNWQFSYQFTPPYKTGGISITVEYNGKSCPQIRFLDSSGRVVEGRAIGYGYDLDQCPSRVSYFEFNPPSEGTYILRLTTPKTSGTYWLKIYKH